MAPLLRMNDSTLLFERAGKAGLMSRIGRETGYDPVNYGVRTIFGLPSD